jgi:hypothetical protein
MNNKKILTIAAAVILIPATCFGLYSMHTHSDDYTSQQYTETVLRRIAKTWSPNDIIMRAHPDMITRNTEEGITQFANIFKQRLGSLKTLEECDGYAAEVHSSNQPSRVTANYHCPAQFEKGKGTINVGLLQNAKHEWKLFSFSVESPLLH